MKETEWCHISNPSHMRRWRNSVESCYLGKVFFVGRERNSYNWSWSSNYFGANSFYPSMKSAAAYVESRRERGSSWTIDELPSVVISGRNVSLCLTSADSRDPFRRLSLTDLPHKTLKCLAADLSRSMTSKDFMFATANGVIRPLETALASYRSFCNDSRWSLRWLKREKCGKPVGSMDSIFELQRKVWKLIN